jgi:hypothetical protein
VACRGHSTAEDTESTERAAPAELEPESHVKKNLDAFDEQHLFAVVDFLQLDFNDLA